MLVSLNLVNFQAHKDTKIHFVPGVNVITGTSDSGKSSVVRGLRWVVQNRPNGTSFIRKGHTEAKVTCLFADTPEITRVREKGFNGYIFGEERFNAVSTNVPDPVQEALNMSETNLQSQFDQFFLLQDSASEVARMFNDVAGLSIIDRALVNVNKKVKGVSTNIFNLTKQKEELAGKIDELAWVHRAAPIVSKAELLEKSITELDQEWGVLQSSVAKREELKESIADCVEFLKVVEDSLIFSKYKEYVSSKIEVDSLFSLVRTIELASKSIPKISGDADKRLTGLVATYVGCAELGLKRDKLESLIKKAKTLLEDCNYYEEEMKTREHELEELIASIGGVCPICGNVMR